MKISNWTQLIKEHYKQTIDGNTYAVRNNNGTMSVQFYNTRVVTYFPNGDVELNTGGMHTSTTLERINRYSPVKVRKVKGDLFIEDADGKPTIPFKDGTTITNDGRVKVE